MATAMRTIYKWSGGVLQPAGAISDAHLRAWEYEVLKESGWRAEERRPETVSLWRTRRPDLAPPELWVGDEEVGEPRTRERRTWEPRSF